jgi:hypothetical protein
VVEALPVLSGGASYLSGEDYRPKPKRRALTRPHLKKETLWISGGLWIPAVDNEIGLGCPL